MHFFAWIRFWSIFILLSLSSVALAVPHFQSELIAQNISGPDKDNPQIPAAIGATQSANDWPQLQHDPQRTGHNPQPITGPFSQKWQRDLAAPMADRIQPVIAAGKVIVGDLNGKVYALNTTNGNTDWTFDTGGSILYTAAISQNNVFVGSHDGYLYALDLNTGSQLWRAAVGKGVGGAPLVWNDQVYASGKDGFFYVFNASTGAQLWKFDTAATTPASIRAPILSSPAVYPSKNLVFFAAENLKAYALNATTGSLVWSAQMYGESAYDSWPVISEAQNTVVFRTKNVYAFQSSLIHDENDLFCPGNSGGECNSCPNLNPANFNSPGEVVNSSGNTSTQWNEQHLSDSDNQIESIDEIFQKYPQRLTFYAFNPDTGAARWSRPAPVLWTGGGGRLGIMPVVNQSSGEIYTFWRTKFSRRDESFFCRRWVDLGRLTERDSLPTVDFLPCPSGVNCPNSQDFHFIGDETTVLSLAGNLLLMTGWFNTGGIYVDTGNAEFVVGSGSGGLPQGGAGSGGDSAAPVSVANKILYLKHHQGFPAQKAEPAPYTIVAAYQGN
jgi:outer membrane protein assembly factor BamB